MAGHIEVDTAELTGDDGDSVYSSGLESDTTSLFTAAKNHTFENGRRYHGYKEGKYLLPNDEAEQDRLDLSHHYRLLALDGRLYTAPIKDKNPQRILDLGTGTGIWCCDMGDEFPEAEVLGTDLSPIQPQWVPPNVKFEIDDFDEDWTWPDNFFDYIHIRDIAGWIQKDSWSHMIKEAYRTLKPGGYLELQDFDNFFYSDDGSVKEDSALRIWVKNFVDALGRAGTPWLEVPQMFKRNLGHEGFTDITESSVKCPIGPWAKDPKMKDMGIFARTNKYDGFESFTLATFTRILGWEVEKVEALSKDVKKDLLNPKLHPTERYYSIYGKKPE